MFDAIVVGARCAGSPTAMNLARAGFSVLVVDRARFPSDTLSTHALTGDASLRLMKWGLLDRVIAANGRPPTDHSIQVAGGVAVRMPGMYFSPR